MKKWGLAALFFILLSVPALSQERGSQIFQGKIGAGFNMHNVTQHKKNMPVLAVKYWISEIVGIEGFAGFDVGNNESFYVIGGKLLGIIQSYKNFNIFTSATMALDFVNPKQSKSYAGVSFLAGAGAEWFILNNISLATEVGLKLSSGNSTTSVKTYADVIPNLSIKFYL
ncbi:MAG: hypothetical protein LBT07_00565 [Endomicrobium sp.]|jgi:hypothetical protein|nr:hypothetical protein [Endomicrobium sp.]